MIRKVTIHNFKSIHKQTYDFEQFDLIIGRNNSGKSTVLQALAIWQYCIDEFLRKPKRKSRGVGVVLPNFTALPVPEFNLLWRGRTDRHNVKGKQEYILIEIDVHWEKEGKSYNFNIQLRYQSPQSIYAIPAGGWQKFEQLNEKQLFPSIAFVPPFSGLEPVEKRYDGGNIRQQIGKAQPGSILRNLLLQVHEESSQNKHKDWEELRKAVKEWFSVDLLPPQYEKGVSTQIICEYKENDKRYDIISGGSGFHQTLTLLAFLYGYHPTTILLDEPDAHLHVNLQQEIIKYFKRQSLDRGTQFLVATHAETLIKEVDVSNVVSLLSQKPKRIQNKENIMQAMAEVTNLEATQILNTEAVLYVEGEDDERILGMWEKTLSLDFLRKVFVRYMGGGSKADMLKRSNSHFKAIKEIVPEAKRLILIDNDGSPHAEPNNAAIYEWKRKNIENYLLVAPAWKKALYKITGTTESDLFAPHEALGMIDKYFKKQGLVLPEEQEWKTLSANIFEEVNGKKILYENSDSLFHQLRKEKMELKKDFVAASMLPEEIHEDIIKFFKKLDSIVSTKR